MLIHVLKWFGKNNNLHGTTIVAAAMTHLIRLGETLWSVIHLWPTVNQKKKLATDLVILPFFFWEPFFLLILGVTYQETCSNNQKVSTLPYT